MNVSKKLFSGILCGSLLLASAPAQCGKKLGVALIAGGTVAGVVAYNYMTLRIFIAENDRLNHQEDRTRYLDYGGIAVETDGYKSAEGDRKQKERNKETLDKQLQKLEKEYKSCEQKKNEFMQKDVADKKEKIELRKELITLQNQSDKNGNRKRLREINRALDKQNNYNQKEIECDNKLKSLAITWEEDKQKLESANKEYLDANKKMIDHFVTVNVQEESGILKYSVSDKSNQQYIRKAKSEMKKTNKGLKQAEKQVFDENIKKYLGIVAGFGLVGYGLWQFFKK